MISLKSNPGHAPTELCGHMVGAQTTVDLEPPTVLLQCSKSTKADQRWSVAKQWTELCQRDFSQSTASFRVHLASDEAVTIVLVYSAMAPPPPPPLPLAFYNVVLHNELKKLRLRPSALKMRVVIKWYELFLISEWSGNMKEKRLYVYLDMCAEWLVAQLLITIDISFVTVGPMCPANVSRYMQVLNYWSHNQNRDVKLGLC